MLKVIANSKAIVKGEVLKANEGNVWQFSIANEGATVLKMGIEGNGTPFLEIPPKPDDGPAYPRVWSTNNPEIPFGSNFEISFVGGTGLAHIVTFSTVGEVENKREVTP